MELLKGFDRYLDLKWTNYCLELYLEPGTTTDKYSELRSYLYQEISGQESARKTANQLKRLWLNDQDEFERLRRSASQTLVKCKVADLAIFHFGMAINALPIFKETCRRLGELSKYQKVVSRRDITNRVSETYLNPSSVPRAIDRVIQTLTNWGFTEIQHGQVHLTERSIIDDGSLVWYIDALISSMQRRELSLLELENLPEKLGVNFINLRDSIHKSSSLSLGRNSLAEEIIILKT